MIVIKRWVIYVALSVLFTLTFYHLSAIPSFEHPGSTRPQEIPATNPVFPHHHNWKERPTKYPVTSLVSLPSGRPIAIPRVQFLFEAEDATRKDIRQRRVQIVKEAFIHSWEGYKKDAWLKDEVAPVTGGYRSTFGGWGATLVDTLDTLWIMGMKADFEEAVDAVSKIDFGNVEQWPLNIFETTIRYLGGLLGAYDISDSNYPVLLSKAIEVGEVLYAAFDTPNRMPITRWNADKGSPQEGALEKTFVAEIGSLSLEFTRLSQLSGDMKYFDAVQRIMDVFDQQQNLTKLPGMWPILVNARTEDFSQDTLFTLGGMADSLYEYLPKEYLLLGGLSDQYQQLYGHAIQTIKSHVLFKPMTETDKKILLPGNVRAYGPKAIHLEPQGQHLACFAGGMVALGSRIFDRIDDIGVARNLVDGCIWAYESMPTGIMPEKFHVVPCRGNSTRPCPWNQTKWGSEMVLRNSHDEQELDLSTPYEERIRTKAQRLRLPAGFSAIGDRRFLLRPEAIESIFVLYRISGDKTLQETAWKMFENIQKIARTEIAYAAIEDVTDRNTTKANQMESFWMAETLKYFYLLYSEPDVVDLDDFVLNTEAHPFRRPK